MNENIWWKIVCWFYRTTQFDFTKTLQRKVNKCYRIKKIYDILPRGIYKITKTIQVVEDKSRPKNC